MHKVFRDNSIIARSRVSWSETAKGYIAQNASRCRHTTRRWRDNDSRRTVAAVAAGSANDD